MLNKINKYIVIAVVFFMMFIVRVDASNIVDFSNCTVKNLKACVEKATSLSDLTVRNLKVIGGEQKQISLINSNETQEGFIFKNIISTPR